MPSVGPFLQLQWQHFRCHCPSIDPGTPTGSRPGTPDPIVGRSHRSRNRRSYGNGAIPAVFPLAAGREEEKVAKNAVGSQTPIPSLNPHQDQFGAVNFERIRVASCGQKAHYRSCERNPLSFSIWLSPQPPRPAVRTLPVHLPKSWGFAKTTILSCKHASFSKGAHYHLRPLR